METKHIKIPQDHPLPTPRDITPSESILYEYPEPYHKESPLSKFWLQCFKCGIIANLGSHDVVEVIEGKVSISPSILCPRETCKNHYHIKNGITI